MIKEIVVHYEVVHLIHGYKKNIELMIDAVWGDTPFMCKN